MRASTSLFVLAAALSGFQGASSAAIPPNRQIPAHSSIHYRIGTPIQTPEAEAVKRDENAVLPTTTQEPTDEVNGVDMNGGIGRRSKGRGRNHNNQNNKKKPDSMPQNTPIPFNTHLSQPAHPQTNPPAHPSQPAPSQSVQPSQSAQPNEPAEPSNPAEPDEPDEPNDPSHSIEFNPEINLSNPTQSDPTQDPALDPVQEQENPESPENPGEEAPPAPARRDLSKRKKHGRPSKPSDIPNPTPSNHASSSAQPQPTPSNHPNEPNNQPDTEPDTEPSHEISTNPEINLPDPTQAQEQEQEQEQKPEENNSDLARRDPRGSRGHHHHHHIELNPTFNFDPTQDSGDGDDSQN